MSRPPGDRGRRGARRTIIISPSHHDTDAEAPENLLVSAVAEAVGSDDVRCTLRHVRIPATHADAFWQRVLELADEFTRLTRSGDTVYGFAAGLYPTGQPVPAEHPTGQPVLAELKSEDHHD